MLCHPERSTAIGIADRSTQSRDLLVVASAYG
jgi:hypothetical protein